MSHNGGDEHFHGQNVSKSKNQTKNNRSRNPNEVSKNSQKSTYGGQRSTSSNLPVNTGSTFMFYKTRLCQKFASDGNCPIGDKCTFAHGPKDLHEPPPNWQKLVKDNRSDDWNNDEKIIQKMRICRRFYNGNRCSYGEKCSFLHQSPDLFKVQQATDSGKTGESSMIKNKTVVDHGQSKDVAGQDSVMTVEDASLKTDEDVLRASVISKTRICSKWETVGHCMFGDKCHFAHGIAELQTSDGSSSVAANKLTEPMNIELVATGSTSDVPTAPPHIGSGFLKLGNKKLVGIYADWIDDGEYLKY